ncbi:predicted protein [Chaetomium globosum CBS 148.51]|uniref:Uncharacterized protein n=1 Tax=Chaetomium globosum (strain ATCC 6205 / CBS 148.51 / DSM 1962 / NBRC 6347 / NRRL 1970) TaxID=306901 RepID=Q2GZI0_CHAGB|nr:uncharacterized protein CHGG_05066 [Chaetomium globosum CBS 148.51]EAQ88447.1 predicted protein [Chaetomium globosum CBS 148.51]
MARKGKMEDDIYNGPNPLHDESDEVLAGTIVHLAKEPNEAVSQVVADEIMTRLRRLRRLESGKAPETGSVGIDVTRIQESIVDAVVDGVGQGTGRAMEDSEKTDAGGPEGVARGPEGTAGSEKEASTCTSNNGSPVVGFSGGWGRGAPEENHTGAAQQENTAQEEAARSSRQGKLTFARKVDTDLTGDRGDGVEGLGVTTPEAAETLEAEGQDVGMQGAGFRKPTPTTRSGRRSRRQEDGGERCPTACRKIQQRLSSRKGNRGRPRTLGPQGPTAVERAAGTVMRWTGGTVDTNRVVEEAWKARWLKERDGRAITRPADDFDHQQETLFRDFLFTRGVPEVLTPACECGEG